MFLISNIFFKGWNITFGIICADTCQYLQFLIKNFITTNCNHEKSSFMLCLIYIYIHRSINDNVVAMWLLCTFCLEIIQSVDIHYFTTFLHHIFHRHSECLHQCWGTYRLSGTIFWLHRLEEQQKVQEKKSATYLDGSYPEHSERSEVWSHHWVLHSCSVAHLNRNIRLD